MADQERSEEDLAELSNFRAAIDDKTAEELERVAQCKSVGQGRRLALVAVARNAETLRRICEEEPEAFGEMREAIERFRTHAKGVLDIAEAACARMEICDTRAH